MAAGFDLMKRYEDGPERLKRSAAFVEAVQVEYKKNTVNDNLRVWAAACETPGVRSRFVDSRRTAKGEWKELMKWYRTSKQK